MLIKLALAVFSWQFAADESLITKEDEKVFCKRIYMVCNRLYSGVSVGVTVFVAHRFHGRYDGCN